MMIQIACPAPPGARNGNRVTAERWRRLLKELGHSVKISHTGAVGPAQLFIGMHATRSAEALAEFTARYPRRPTIVGLMGTDIYAGLPGTPSAWKVLEEASKIVVLHPLASQDLPPGLRSKTRVLIQSAQPADPKPRWTSSEFFDVAFVANLREVKDPFRVEDAVRGLPQTSKVRVRHVGAALDADLGDEARRRAAANPRYVWLGEMPEGDTRRLIASSRVLVLSSKSEGGANVISEAIVSKVPVIASRIPCTEGLLGRRYPGLFRVGDTEALRRLLLRAERDRGYLKRLASWCSSRRWMFETARERRAWKDLLSELRPSVPRHRRSA